MDENLKEWINEEILRQIDSIKKDLSDFRERADAVGQDQPIGRLSRMYSITNQGIPLSGIDKSRTRLGRLENALRRLADPDTVWSAGKESLLSACWTSRNPICLSPAPRRSDHDHES